MPVKTTPQRLRAKRYALLKQKSARQKASQRAAAKSTGADEKSAAARDVKVKAAVLAARLAARTLRAAAARRVAARVAAQARSMDVARGALTFSAGLQPVVEAHQDLVACTRELARRVSFSVATRTISGTPIQSTRGQQEHMELDGLRPNEKARDVAIARLEKLGFEVLHKGRFATTVAGPAELVREVLGEPLMVMRQAEKPANRAAAAFSAETSPPDPHELFVAPASSLSVRPEGLDPVFDHFVFAPPALQFAVISASLPKSSYLALDAARVRALLNVPPVAGSGKGSKLAMVDSGFHNTHPFYVTRKFALSAHASPGGPTGSHDPDGHGTSMASNIFALAPEAEVFGVRQSHAPYTDAVEVGLDNLGADILTCSWGWDREQSFPTLEATLRSFIQEGKLVVFAAGNGHYAWPGSMPEVISIGGVYADAAGRLEASDYASGFVSSLYPGRQVPDVCGLCGLQPRAIYIPMPCPAGSTMDTKYAGRKFPNGDETHARDGWVVASGTSAATPQVAGVLAQLLQAVRARGTTLTNAMAKDLLQQSAINVSRGRNAFGFPASTSQPNGAVGWGLVDVDALFSLARSRALI